MPNTPKRRPPQEKIDRLLLRPAQPALWLGARRTLPLQDCDVCVWFDTRQGDVRLAAYVPRNSPPEVLGVLFGEAMISPRQGRPARPRSVVVMTAEDEPPVRALAGMLGVHVLDVPDASMFAAMLNNLEQLLDVPEVG